LNLLWKLREIFRRPRPDIRIHKGRRISASADMPAGAETRRPVSVAVSPHITLNSQYFGVEFRWKSPGAAGWAAAICNTLIRPALRRFLSKVARVAAPIVLERAMGAD
jgi:hypothetical protein